jgi:hypothetical protein
MLTYLDERLRLLRLHMGADGADALEALVREVDAALVSHAATLSSEAGLLDAVQLFVGQETAVVTLTTDEVKLLNTTPIALVAAPGAGKALVLDEAVLLLDWVTPKYDGIAEGEDLNIRYTDGSGALVSTIEATGFLDQEADTLRLAKPALEVAPVANAALVLYMATGNIATGNSPLKVKVRYHTIDTAF